MKLLLDTHILLWWLKADPRLTSKLRAVLEQAETLYLSSVVVYEAGVKVRLGKLSLDRSVAETMELARRNAGLVDLPLEAGHALLAAELPLIHRDPFDRLLIAQAKIEKLTLVSSDLAMQQYDVALISA